MKSIFTYPLNTATSNIHPDYNGDDTVGYQKRVKELKDGTYKAHLNPTTITSTVSDLMKAHPAFNNNPVLEESTGNNTIYKFWEQPIMQGHMELIESDISSATAVDATTSNVEFSGDHGFYQGQLMTLSNFNNSWSGLNGNDYYVKKIDDNTIQLAIDSGLTNLIEFYDLENADISAATAANPAVFTDASHDLTDGTLVTASGFNNSLANLNGGQFYVQNSTATTLQLSTDAAGTHIIGYTTSSTDNDIDHFILNKDNSIDLIADSAVDQLPAGTTVNFDPNDTTTHSVYGQNKGISTELDDEGDLYIDEVATDKYKLYTNSNLTTKLNWKTDLLSNNFVKDTNIAFERLTDTYTLKYTLTGTDGDHTGEYLNNHQLTDATALPDVSKTTTYFLGRVSGDDYRIYTDAARTNLVDIGNNIINAERVLLKKSSTEYRLFVPKIYDSAGNAITDSMIMVDDATIPSLSSLDTVLAAESYNCDQETGIDNTPTGNVTLSRRTATYDSKPVLDISSGTLSNNIDTSGFTAYDFRITYPASGDTWEIVDASGDTGTQTMYDHLKTLYDADADDVIGRPFVVNNTYNDGANTTTNVLYMVIFAFNTDRFRLKVFNINDNGIPKRVVSQATNNVQERLLDNAGIERLRTFLQEPFNNDTTGGSLQTYTSTSWATFGGLLINNTAHSLNTGDICTQKVYRTSDDALQNTTSNLMAVVQKYTSSQDIIYFVQLDTNNNLTEIDTGNGYIATPTNPSASHRVEIETNHESAFTTSGTDYHSETVADNNYAFVTTELDKVLTDGKVWTNTTGTKYTLATTFDVIAQTLTDATTGDLEEVYTPPTANIIPRRDLTAATAGTLTIEANETNRYRLSGITPRWFGNKTFLQRTGESTYVGNAEIKANEYWLAGGTSLNTSYGHWPTGLTVGTNSSGYINSFTGFDTEFPGAFPNSDDVMFTVQTVADTYTPPALSTEAQEDIWDLDSEWNNTLYSGKKTFPTTVTPSSLTFRVTSPTATTQSQNGTKYTRTANYTKYSFDVEYPPMTAEQYEDYNGFINTLQGQKHPFYFLLHQNGTRMLGNRTTGVTNVIRYKDEGTAGDITVLAEGFASNQSEVVRRGELFIMSDEKHGNIKTAGSSTDANVYGEAKFRISTPIHSTQAPGNRIYQDPFHIIVSLDADTVQVTRDTAGFYNLSMTFTADEWK